ncbi:MAG TPA: SPFH domain-containing protein [Acidobacteriota bacterium]|nr:SPFH domain-containing protein [Acidobacteriota bacterium]HNT17126.1 SPFH domain-containing protein [Acidobacteriota bacterium]
MAILDLIEFFDDSGEIMVQKIPYEGSGQFRLGSQLVVQESQVAVFFRDGKALDSFLPGRHTLSTANLPLLGSIIGAPFGGQSPFRSYVYFIATKTFINLGWGTSSPVFFRDSDFRMINLRAHGSFSIRMVKYRTFLNTLVGTRGLETTFAIEEFFKSMIVSRLNEVLGSVMKSILDLPVVYNTISLKTKEALAADFDQYGLYLVDLIIEAITPPPEVQEMINKASGLAIQDVERYRSIAAADAMRDAAKNPHGIAGEGMGAGMGLAMGLGMAQQFSQNLNTVRPAADPGALGQPKLTSEEVRERLKQLKEMMDEGLITPTDFEEKKKKLLDSM